MKHKISLFTAIIITATVFTTSCNSHQKNGDELATTTTDTTTVSAMATDTLKQARQDWETFKADANEKVKQNDDSIEALKQRTDKAGKKMKAKLDKDIAKMKERNEELKARLNNFNEEGKEKWDKFKYDFKNDMDTISVKWKELTKKENS